MMEYAGVMGSMQRWSRFILLGQDNSWGATLATGPTGITVLAALALLMNALDLVTGVRMMLVYGISLEQNPLARMVMESAGPLGLIGLKLFVVCAGLLLFMRTAQVGRGRLARNCLLLALGIGMLGATSNLVG